MTKGPLSPFCAAMCHVAFVSIGSKPEGATPPPMLGGEEPRHDTARACKQQKQLPAEQGGALDMAQQPVPLTTQQPACSPAAPNTATRRGRQKNRSKGKEGSQAGAPVSEPGHVWGNYGRQPAGPAEGTNTNPCPKIIGKGGTPNKVIGKLCQWGLQLADATHHAMDKQV